MGAEGQTILVVDDEPGVRVAIQRILELDFPRVVVAADAEQALGQLRAHPDVVLLITDVVMPGMHGPALARVAKAARPELLVMFVSGSVGDARQRTQLELLGTWLTKPFTPEVLLEAVHTLLKRAPG